MAKKSKTGTFVIFALPLVVAATAVVKAIHDTGTRVNDNPEVELTLEVQRQGAQPYTATVTTVVSVVNLPSLQPGKTVKVRYDPKHPSKVALDD